MMRHIFQCPQCTGSISPKDHPTALQCVDCERSYPVEGTIPVFTEASPQAGGSFDYREHYAVDNRTYDYFQERGAATRHEEFRLRQTIARRVPDEVRSILDVGCGGAWVAETFLPQKREVCSLDITPVNPQRALERHPSPNHYGVAADALNLPFKDGSFDCVIAAEIIEHVVAPSAFVASLMRVVRPGGVLIVSTPYRERIRETLCVHCNRLTPLDAHLHSFDEHVLLDLYREDDLASANWTTCSNKALTILRTHVVTQHLPYPLWRITDAAMNRVTGKPHRIVGEFRKRGEQAPGS